MANSYISCYLHVVFSTKNRRPLIDSDLQKRLWPYLGGIARENGIKALSIGGISDHVHLLLSLPSTITIAKSVQLIKGGSSKWIHETFPVKKDFAWQEGYGAFSINISIIEETIKYIERQEEHHRKRSFKEEYFDFLKKHGIEYDERYVLG
jgi:REP element-mobilizing transposase RayT